MEIRARTDNERQEIRHLASVLPLFVKKYYSYIFGNDMDSSQELIQFYNVSIPYPYSHGRYEYPWRLDDPYPILNQLAQNAKMYLLEYDPEEIISYSIFKILNVYLPIRDQCLMYTHSMDKILRRCSTFTYYSTYNQCFMYYYLDG